jgi:hypothetical protein
MVSASTCKFEVSTGMRGDPHTWETDMGNDITFVGLDVSKATISVGLAPGDRRQSASYFGNIAYQPAALDSARFAVPEVVSGELVLALLL